MADVAAEGASGEAEMQQPVNMEPEPLAVLDAPAAEVLAAPVVSNRKSPRKRSVQEPVPESQQKRGRGRARGGRARTRSAAAAKADAEADVEIIQIEDEAAEAEADVASPVPGAVKAETGGQAEETGRSEAQARTFTKKLSELEKRMRIQEMTTEQVLGSQKLELVAVKELLASISKAVQDFNKILKQKQ